MTSRPRVGVDLDGCLYDWEGTARALIFRTWGIGLPVSTNYNAIRDGVPQHVWKWLWEPARMAELFGDPRAGIRDGLVVCDALDRVADLVVITKRPAMATRDTCRWLAAVRFPGREVHILNQDDDKSAIPCDWYVDDATTIVNELVDHGCKTYIIDRPWNQDCDRGIRVKNWYEIAEKELKK